MHFRSSFLWRSCFPGFQSALKHLKTIGALPTVCFYNQFLGIWPLTKGHLERFLEQTWRGSHFWDPDKMTPEVLRTLQFRDFEAPGPGSMQKNMWDMYGYYRQCVPVKEPRCWLPMPGKTSAGCVKCCGKLLSKVNMQNKCPFSSEFPRSKCCNEAVPSQARGEEETEEEQEEEEE